MGLLRHTGLMNPDMVADAVVTAITLPTACQFDTLSVAPTAPMEPTPETFTDWKQAMMDRYMPS